MHQWQVLKTIYSQNLKSGKIILAKEEAAEIAALHQRDVGKTYYDQDNRLDVVVRKVNAEPKNNQQDESHKDFEK